MEKIVYEKRRLQLTQLNLKFLGEESPDELDHCALSELPLAIKSAIVIAAT